MAYHDLLMKWCMILERTVHEENLKFSYHFLLVAKIFHQNVVYTYKNLRNFGGGAIIDFKDWDKTFGVVEENRNVFGNELEKGNIF